MGFSSVPRQVERWDPRAIQGDVAGRIQSTIDGWGSIRILRDSLGPHPQFFLRMLADNGDVVVDPVAGSCTTSDAADLLERKLAYCEPRESYLEGGGSRRVPWQDRVEARA